MIVFIDSSMVKVSERFEKNIERIDKSNNKSPFLRVVSYDGRGIIE